MAANDFNNKYCDRTKAFAIHLCRLMKQTGPGDTGIVIRRQMIRSACSMAANIRAASRARSPAEYYAKMCIVVEESDETLFWIDLLTETEPLKNEAIMKLKKEAEELLKIFSATKRTLRSKLTS
jgi:four helix bundle protein